MGEMKLSDNEKNSLTRVSMGIIITFIIASIFWTINLFVDWRAIITDPHCAYFILGNGLDELTAISGIEVFFICIAIVVVVFACLASRAELLPSPLSIEAICVSIAGFQGLFNTYADAFGLSDLLLAGGDFIFFFSDISTG